MAGKQKDTNKALKVNASVRLDLEAFAFYEEWAVRERRTVAQVLRLALDDYRILKIAEKESQCSN